MSAGLVLIPVRSQRPDSDRQPWFGAFVDLYNIWLEEVRRKGRSWESDEIRPGKVLKMLSATDSEKLKPSADSVKGEQDETLPRTKVGSLECGNGFNFREPLENGQN